MEGDLARTLQEHLPRIGHIQLADNPGRHEPGSGEINFPFLLRHLDAIGYSGWVGCEYKPRSQRRQLRLDAAVAVSFLRSGPCCAAFSMRRSARPMRRIACPPSCPRRPRGAPWWSAPARRPPPWRARSRTHWRGDAGRLSGLVVTRYGHGLPTRRIEVVEASHPAPDAAGQIAAARILDAVKGLGRGRPGAGAALGRRLGPAGGAAGRHHAGARSAP
jgi:hypothetical protein